MGSSLPVGEQLRAKTWSNEQFELDCDAVQENELKKQVSSRLFGVAKKHPVVKTVVLKSVPLNQNKVFGQGLGVQDYIKAE